MEQFMAMKFLECQCPSTKRIYFLGTAENTCWQAKSKSWGFNSNEIEYINEW